MTTSEMKENLSYSETLRSALKQKILSGELLFGQEVNQLKLANEFNVSRTPVRSALVQLVEDELMGYDHNRGFYVCWNPLRNLTELVMIQQELDLLAYWNAASQLTVQDKKMLETTINHIVMYQELKRTDTLYELFFQVNHSLYEISKMRHLKKISRQIEVILLPYLQVLSCASKDVDHLMLKQKIVLQSVVQRDQTGLSASVKNRNQYMIQIIEKEFG